MTSTVRDSISLPNSGSPTPQWTVALTRVLSDYFTEHARAINLQSASWVQDVAGQTLTSSFPVLGGIKKLTGDLHSATPADTLQLQSSSTNQPTYFGLVPNGTSVLSGLNAYSSSDPANSSIASVRIDPSVGMIVSATRSGSGSYLPMVFYTSSTERLRINPDGTTIRNHTAAVWGFNANATDTTGGTHYALVTTWGTGATVVGSVSYTASATAYNTSSDRRLKSNIAPAADSGPAIDAIDIVQFDFAGTHVRWGAIAQDLAATLPEVVTATDDGIGELAEGTMPWQVAYPSAVPLLIDQVKRLRTRVASLEAQLAALSDRLTKGGL